MNFINWSKRALAKAEDPSSGNDLVHKSFEVAILIKGIDGILEIIGGFLLLLLSPVRLNAVVAFLTQHELSTDPKDVIANLMVHLASNFSTNTQYFAFYYLALHGVIKVFLVLLLWKKKIWAYPLTIISLFIFIVYQAYRYTIYHSFWMILLTIFDIIVIILTFIEYKRIKSEIIN
ncbi:MAG: DUF2127 domain-containing protein [Eubacteriales bacterium]